MADSLIKFTSSFTNDGKIFLTACGRIISFVIKNFGIARASAASNCPLSTVLIPALITSETYAPELREKEIAPP